MLCAAQQIKPAIVRFVPTRGGRGMHKSHINVKIQKIQFFYVF